MMIYYPNKNGNVFQGNQYVTTKSLKDFGTKFFKFANIASITTCAGDIAIGLRKDWNVYQNTGNSNMYNTSKALGRAIGAI